MKLCSTIFMSIKINFKQGGAGIRLTSGWGYLVLEIHFRNVRNFELFMLFWQFEGSTP